MMDIYFGIVHILPFVQLREHPEFTELIQMDKRHWPRCLPGHGWLPAVAGNSFGSPCATLPEEVASNNIEWVWEAY